MKRDWFAGLAWAVVGTAALLSGCAVTPGSEAPAQDLRTASDQTDNDRRARVRLELASAYFSRGQMETALDEIKQALQVNPNLVEGINLRGLIYAGMGEARLAEESFRRALQLSPKDADVMHNHAWFLCQQRRFAEGDVLFVSALSQPQYRSTLRTLLARGVCQARAGQLPQAEQSLSRALELDPANPTTTLNLAEVLYQRGAFDRARFYVARVNAQPEFTNAETLWLAIRIENRLGDRVALDGFARQLRTRFAQSAQALALERGRFDD